MAWPCNFTIFPHSSLALAWGMRLSGEFSEIKVHLCFLRSVCSSASLERKSRVRDASSHTGICFMVSFMSKATCLRVTEFSDTFLRFGSQVHTFRGPHWCEYCANFMWGLIAQGVRCSGRHGTFFLLFHLHKVSSGLHGGHLFRAGK